MTVDITEDIGKIKSMTQQCKSLAELMHEAFCLSMDLAYVELAPDDSYLTARQTDIGNESENDMVWAWCDGLMHKYYENVSTGHCSMQAMIDFDVADWEAKVIKNIETMNRLLERYGKPVKLDFAEMQRRGYTGKWAGMESEKVVDNKK